MGGPFRGAPISDYNAWNRGLNAVGCFNKIFAFLGKLESQGIKMKVQY